jgi:hypothetical protein
MVDEPKSEQEIWKDPVNSIHTKKTGGLGPGKFKPIAEPGAVEKDPAVFTGLEKVWVTVDKVGIPTFGLEGTGSARPPTLAPAPEGSGILEETDMIGLPISTLLKDWAQTHPKNNPDPLY